MSWVKDKYGIMALGFVFTVVLDQLTKALVIAHFPTETGQSIIPGFFDIHHAHNPGAAFGLFRGHPILFFLLISSVAVGFILYYFVKLHKNDVMLAAALSFILGGATGNNLLDRVRHGFVIDFLRFYVGDYSWPTFNVADIAIVAGVVLFAYDMFRQEFRARHGAEA